MARKRCRKVSTDRNGAASGAGGAAGGAYDTFNEIIYANPRLQEYYTAVFGPELYEAIFASLRTPLPAAVRVSRTVPLWRLTAWTCERLVKGGGEAEAVLRRFADGTPETPAASEAPAEAPAKAAAEPAAKTAAKAAAEAAAEGPKAPAAPAAPAVPPALPPSLAPSAILPAKRIALGVNDCTTVRPVPWGPPHTFSFLSLNKVGIKKLPAFRALKRFLVNEDSRGALARQELASMLPPLVLGGAELPAPPAEPGTLAELAAPGPAQPGALAALAAPETAPRRALEKSFQAVNASDVSSSVLGAGLPAPPTARTIAAPLHFVSPGSSAPPQPPPASPAPTAPPASPAPTAPPASPAPTAPPALPAPIAAAIRYFLDMCAAPGSKTSQLLDMVHSGATRYFLDMCAAPGSKTSQLLDMVHSGALPSACVIANELEARRATTLAHQVHRLGCENCVITRGDAAFFPKDFLSGGGGLAGGAAGGGVVAGPDAAAGSAAADSAAADSAVAGFAGVLADVPCSGDGTLRKQPDIWRSWTVSGALALHAKQVAILRRGLELLAPAGRLVYSTCSMNPVENEAVVAAVLGQWAGPTVALLDVGRLLRARGCAVAPGMPSWPVFDCDQPIAKKRGGKAGGGEAGSGEAGGGEAGGGSPGRACIAAGGIAGGSLARGSRADGASSSCDSAVESDDGRATGEKKSVPAPEKSLERRAEGAGAGAGGGAAGGSGAGGGGAGGGDPPPLTRYTSFADVPPHRRSVMKRTMFPPLAASALAALLPRCARLNPHENNTGAFFVAVFERTGGPGEGTGGEASVKGVGASPAATAAVAEAGAGAAAGVGAAAGPRPPAKRRRQADDRFLVADNTKGELAKALQFFGVWNGAPESPPAQSVATQSPPAQSADLPAQSADLPTQSLASQAPAAPAKPFSSAPAPAPPTPLPASPPPAPPPPAPPPPASPPALTWDRADLRLLPQLSSAPRVTLHPPPHCPASSPLRLDLSAGAAAPGAAEVAALWGPRRAAPHFVFRDCNPNCFHLASPEAAAVVAAAAGGAGGGLAGGGAGSRAGGAAGGPGGGGAGGRAAGSAAAGPATSVVSCGVRALVALDRAAAKLGFGCNLRVAQPAAAAFLRFASRRVIFCALELAPPFLMTRRAVLKEQLLDAESRGRVLNLASVRDEGGNMVPGGVIVVFAPPTIWGAGAEGDAGGGGAGGDGAEGEADAEAGGNTKREAGGEAEGEASCGEAGREAGGEMAAAVSTAASTPVPASTSAAADISPYFREQATLRDLVPVSGILTPAGILVPYISKEEAQLYAVHLCPADAAGPPASGPDE